MAGINETHPDVAAEWHPTKNGDLSPAQVTKGSERLVYWLCPVGHEYQSKVKNRVKATGCQVCSNRLLITGVNDLATRFPEIAKEWHREKNVISDPSKTVGGGSARVWWKCELGHEWQVKTVSRIYFGSGCPYCSGHKTWPGFNDLATTNPTLADEWHPTKNGSLLPTQLREGAHQKIWWRCKHGHEWCALVSSRSNQGVGCPVCSNKQIVPGINDLQTSFPQIATEWADVKNLPISASRVAPYTSKAYWWKCPSGHEWQTSVVNRTKLKSQCPYCEGQRPIPGETDLATTHPYLVKEWHATKNRNLKPSDVMAGTDRKIWWQCKNGHEWAAPPFNRKKGVGCPSCAKSGYSPDEKGYLYLLTKEEGQLQQFGITNSPENRLRTHKKNGWEVLDVVGPADGLWVLQTETALKRFFRVSDLLLPRDYPDKFDGFSESWDSTSLTFSSVAKMLDALRQFEDADRHAKRIDEG